MKFAEKLQDYSFKIEYVQGIKNEVADALSRNPVTKQNVVEHNIENRLMVNLISEFQGKEVCSMKQLKGIAKNDNDYRLIKDALQDGIKAKDIPQITLHDHTKQIGTCWRLIKTWSQLAIES